MERKLAIVSTLLIISLVSNVLVYGLLIVENEKTIEVSAPTKKIVSAPKTTIRAPAVTDDGEGIIIEISVEIQKGTGQILVGTEPLTGLTFQESARTAVQVATTLSNVDTSEANIIFTVTADATSIDGPSAGAAMTTLVYSAITGKAVNQSVMMTGTIEQDGSIGNVGGIVAKIEASSEVGVKTFLIPQGQSIQTIWVKKEQIIDLWIFKIVRVYYVPETMDLAEYAQKSFGIKLIEVKDIGEVLSIALIWD
ncbi:MAG: S16 family serine protease [Nitrososphaerales archaeon]